MESENKGPVIENRHYSEEFQTKEITIELESLSVETTAGHMDYTIGIEEDRKEYAAHHLSRLVKKYIKTEIVRRGQEKTVKATIHLPYVYDGVLTRLNLKLRFLDNYKKRILATNVRLLRKIKYLELPWYKKLWLWIKKNGKN